MNRTSQAAEALIGTEPIVVGAAEASAISCQGDSQTEPLNWPIRAH